MTGDPVRHAKAIALERLEVYAWTVARWIVVALDTTLRVLFGLHDWWQGTRDALARHRRKAPP
jgi:hypothetical protein